MKASERAFEDAIESCLLDTGDCDTVSPEALVATLGLVPETLIAFLHETQEKAWTQLVSRYGGSSSDAEAGFLRRLAAEIDDRGTLDVLRHGIVDQGVQFRVAFFKPAHGLTPELLARYEANRLSVMRQVPYQGGETKTLDLCLFVNGIPVATAELKNPLTHQTVEHAKEQYRYDRDPNNVLLGRRALVHFAVDPEEVAMTTKLEGPRTQFLPFNLGADGGAGNPPNPDGLPHFVPVGAGVAARCLARPAGAVHARRDALRGVEGGEAQAGTSHLPALPSMGRRAEARSGRSRQTGRAPTTWCSTRLGRASRTRLPGSHTGSRPCTTTSDEKVFDKVVVITDRVVLDRQLQDTIFQFEHVRGVVEKIDKDSAQLGDALAGEQARIIITTLQKFPFILDRIEEFPQRRYAVIVDEAHSSQTGEAAKDLKLALGAAGRRRRACRGGGV